MHVHVHVIPRLTGDGLITLPVSGSMIAKGDAEELLEQLQKSL